MNDMIEKFVNFIRKPFYRCGIEYMVPVDRIKISDDFSSTPIGIRKMNRKTAYWMQNGSFESKIIIDRDTFTLLNGYTSYSIAKLNKIKNVPVTFTDCPINKEA